MIKMVSDQWKMPTEVWLKLKCRFLYASWKEGVIVSNITLSIILPNTCVYRTNLRNKQKLSSDKFKVHSESKGVPAGMVTYIGPVLPAEKKSRGGWPRGSGESCYSISIWKKLPLKGVIMSHRQPAIQPVHQTDRDWGTPPPPSTLETSNQSATQGNYCSHSWVLVVSVIVAILHSGHEYINILIIWPHRYSSFHCHKSVLPIITTRHT